MSTELAERPGPQGTAANDPRSAGANLAANDHRAARPESAANECEADAASPPVVDDELVAIAREWGWQHPTKTILRLAQDARRARTTKSAQLLVDLGAISQEQRTRCLATKPPHVQTIAWITQQEAAVPRAMDRVLALKNGYAYYEPLSVLSVHPCMQIDAVMKRAEEIDAAVMMIEGSKPVLVFSTFATLLKFASLGRAERRRDPILQALDTQPALAAAARDEISAVLKSVHATDDTFDSFDSSSVWDAEAAENRTDPTVRSISRLIDHALAQGATDIALSPTRDGRLAVHMRKFGRLIAPKHVESRMSAEVALEVLHFLQSRSGANPTNTVQRLPSDGQITYRSAVGDAFLRLSFIPLNHLGEIRNLNSISIRLLPRSESRVSLSGLNLAENVIDEFRFAMQLSQGLVLVVGPTNSGKSTTIAGAINEHVALFGDTHKRVSVEDPVERFFSGLVQINVPQGALLKDEDERFAVVLRAIKRHDPDLIWVGEVRDRMTADLCLAAGSTGHLVLSTLHAKDAVMGFDVLAKTVDANKRFQFVESLSLIVSQRLVKELCPRCRTIAAKTNADQNVFTRYLDVLGDEATLPAEIARANPAGCDACGGEGYVGELPINEVLPFTRKVKDAALEMLHGGNRRNVLAAARRLTLLDSSLALIAAHRVDINDLLV